MEDSQHYGTATEQARETVLLVHIEDPIAANHHLHKIDGCFDLSDPRHYLADFYSSIGRPSIDPELMIRLLVVGYCYGIRSKRRLCESFI